MYQIIGETVQKSEALSHYQVIPFCLSIPYAVGEEDITRPIGRLLKQSPWWPVLEAAFAEGGRDQVRDCYLEDYVRMVYKPQTKTEEIEYEVSITPTIVISVDTTTTPLTSAIP